MTNKIQLDQNGLIPAIAQHAETSEVLMMGYMNPGSIKRTLESGEVWFYSRSRSDLWHKGEISGNFLRTKQIIVDCDGDTLLLKVIPDGPTCHTGEKSCFSTQLSNYEFVDFDKGSNVIEELFAVIQDRKLNPSNKSYTSQLISDGIERIAQKIIEEAGEVAIAAVTRQENETAEEISDLLYHTLVLLSEMEMNPEKVWEVLRSRRT
ncbi:MAG: bifunctional phosphoribosyl-AMP cyclohydrolase/phosphoribosyl-ATP diphosphatase HisIE [SAR202 cluster bacterium]|nr:bifunctional phosphoribosyl-AMP cyclohydrolase/phosphoribosyl-ATP diphosphatase HisIE [SAR202 cluster bacterium]